MISRETLDRIRSANDIVDTINRYIPLKRAGSNHIALCPFHREKTPSFNVNPHRQIFHCFGCGKGGDVIAFVMEHEKLPFADAVKRLADEARIPIEENESPEAKAKRTEASEMMYVHNTIASIFHEALTGSPAEDYLISRDIGRTIADKFQLGYGVSSLGSHYSWEILNSCGIISDQGFPRFAGRVIFPIHDDMGRPVGFSGRLIQGQDSMAKYVNSPTTAIFSKGKILYGLHLAKDSISKHGALIVEGPMDVLRCHQVGITHVVAPQGTALTEDHARLIKRYTDMVTLCFDSDKAGMDATMKAGDQLLSAGLEVHVVTMPDGHDPDSYIMANGPDRFIELLDAAIPFITFKLIVLLNNAMQPQRIVESMARTVCRTKNHVIIEQCAQTVAKKLGLNPSSVLHEFHKFNDTHWTDRESPKAKDEPQVVEKIEEPISLAEQWLLRIVLLSDEYACWAHAALSLEWVQSQQVREILYWRFELSMNNSWSGIPDLLTLTESESQCRLITEAAADPMNIADPELMLKGGAGKKGIVQTIRDDYADRMILGLQTELANGPIDHEQICKIESTKLAMRSLKQQPIMP